MGEVSSFEFTISIGEDVKIGCAICTLDCVSGEREISSPISGELVEINEAVQYKSKLINYSPEEGGWLAKIHINDASELEALLNKKTYKAYCKDNC